MVGQYPHTIIVTTTANAVKDGSGNWVPGLPTQKSYACRAEPPNGVGAGAGKVKGVDGAVTDYTWMIYMKPIKDIITAGSLVELHRNGEVFDETVKQFISGSFNAQVWL